MELFYKTPQGNEVRWLVKELVPGQRYQIVETNGKPAPQPVDASEGRSRAIIFFDGFVIQENKIYAVSLLSGDPKIEVGHTPCTA